MPLSKHSTTREPPACRYATRMQATHRNQSVRLHSTFCKRQVCST